MTAKVYYDRLGRLLLGKGTSMTVDLGDLEFYVAKGHTSNQKPNQVYLIMTDIQGMRDIIELEYKGVANDPVYRVYAPALRHHVRVKNGSTQLQLMELVPGSDEYTLSTILQLTVTTDQYELTRQVYLTEALGTKVKEYYSRIVDLFQQLKEDIEKGE